MKVKNVAVDKTSGAPVVFLEEIGGTRVLPIWVGFAEAQAIAMQMEGVKPPRPMTHDLMKSVMERSGVTLERVVIVDLRENTYYARLELKSGGRSISVDSRPSDAIALAIRFERPIFVAPELLRGSAGGDVVASSSEVARVRGVTVQELSGELAEHFGVASGGGLLVSAVEGRRPLRRGDLIVEAEGRPVRNAAEFASMVARLGEKPVRLLVRRGSRTVRVELPGP